MQSSQLDDLDDVTEVDAEPVENLTGEATAEHDCAPWMKWFTEGVGAGRLDVLGALGRVLGTGPFADDLMLKVLAELEPKVKPPQ